MQALAKVFFWGMFISFMGTLPVGTMNVAAMQVAIEEGIAQSIYFSLGTVTLEMIYVRISLVAIDWIMKRKKLLKYMEWGTFVIIAFLALGSFLAAMKSNPHAKSILLDNDLNRFVLGFLLNCINPTLIAFWFGWSTVLFTKNVLQPTPASYNFYVVGLGIGTMLGKSIYIFGGPWIVQKITGIQDYMNWIIGGIFTVTAILQLVKILRHKGIEQKMKELEKPAGTRV